MSRLSPCFERFREARPEPLQIVGSMLEAVKSKASARTNGVQGVGRKTLANDVDAWKIQARALSRVA